MKVTCKVIQDLLPLYHDSVCSPETAALVEEHLKDCEACQEVFHRLQDASSLPLPVSGKEERKAEGLAKVKKALRKKRVIVVSIVAAVVLVLGVSAGLLMNMRFLSAGLDALESISVKEDTLTINLKDDRWTGVLGYSSMYLEENGELVPIVVVDVTATPADYLWGQYNQAPKSVPIYLKDSYSLLFLSDGVYRQACEELGYEYGTYSDDATQQEIENKVQEILADWEPGDEGIQRVYWYSGSTVQGPGNLDISREDMMANLDKHGTLLWTAEDGVVYNP